MDSSDVTITASTLCEGGVTMVTLESLTLMDTSDVKINTFTVFECGVRFIAAMYFQHFSH